MSEHPYHQPELTFSDLVADPLIRAIMEADGIDERELRELFTRTGRLQDQKPRGRDIWDGANSGPPEPMRRGVGVVLLNRDGSVFVGQRVDVAGMAWQMPQGGIDPGETPRAAALRELWEELGTANADVVAETQGWYSYELPHEILARARHASFRGQMQQWFLMRFRGADSEIDVMTEHPEFSAWKWAPPGQLLDLIVPFKRELYRQVLNEFAVHLRLPPSTHDLWRSYLARSERFAVFL